MYRTDLDLLVLQPRAGGRNEMTAPQKLLRKNQNMISALDVLTVLNSIAILFAIASGADPLIRHELNKRGALLFFALVTGQGAPRSAMALAHVFIIGLLVLVIADVETTILSIISWFLLTIHAMTQIDAVVFE